MKNLIYFFFLVILVSSSCTKDDALVWDTPNLPDQTYQYSGNDELATLGRVLFYDKTLSINKSVSCGSCHKQQFAFADNVDFSTGVNVTKTLRNAQALFNLRRHQNLFWDSRETSLTRLIFSPITDHIEMGIMDEEAMARTIEYTPYYKALFEDAYGMHYEVNKASISEAIAEFLISLESNNSKYDRVNNGLENFTLSEKNGESLFFGRANCWFCHSGNNFKSQDWANIGLEVEYIDKGVGAVRNSSAEEGSFVTPSLRNVELTAPYMHDGRFETLEEVINHYNSSMVAHPNLHWIFTENQTVLDNPSGWWIEPQNGGVPVSPNLSEAEITDLIAFLKTLTDQSFCTDVRYSDPFAF